MAKKQSLTKTLQQELKRVSTEFRKREWQLQRAIDVCTAKALELNRTEKGGVELVKSISIDAGRRMEGRRMAHQLLMETVDRLRFEYSRAMGVASLLRLELHTLQNRIEALEDEVLRVGSEVSRLAMDIASVDRRGVHAA